MEEIFLYYFRHSDYEAYSHTFRYSYFLRRKRDQLFGCSTFRFKHSTFVDVGSYLHESNGGFQYPNICNYAYSKYCWVEMLLRQKNYFLIKVRIINDLFHHILAKLTRQLKSSSSNSWASVTLKGWNLFVYNILWTDFVLVCCFWVSQGRVQCGDSGK